VKLDLLKREDLPADIITVSPSQLSAWYRCQYLWKLMKIDNVGDEDYNVYGAANRGQVLHAFCKWLYDHSIGRAVGTLSEVGKMKLIEDVQRVHQTDGNFWQVYAIFQAYVEWAAKKDELVAHGAEVETFAPTGLTSRDGRLIYFHGFIDLIASLFDKLLVVDHKSHTNRPWTRERLFYDHQLIFYWLLLELQGVQVDGAMVNAVNLFIPKNSGDFHPERTVQMKASNVPGRKTKTLVPRFERFTIGPNDVKLQFYLDEFLTNIKQMWCGEPVYPMRLSSDCQFCSFKAHIELDAKGMHEGALANLRTRHNTGDFDLVDDLEDAEL